MHLIATRILVFFALSVLLSACSNTGYGGFGLTDRGPGGGSSPPPGAFTSSTADPLGDALATTGGTAWDITQVDTSRLLSGAITLTVNVTFAQAISAAILPAPGGTPSGTQLVATLLFSTGTSNASVHFPPGVCPGNAVVSNVTYLMGLTGKRLADGNYAITNAVTGSQTGEASVTFPGPNTASYNVPISAIGAGTGATSMLAVAGNGFGFTDCAPNAGFIGT
ncbi:MAG: hypothetical protein M3160_01560 [Candidatus Eremiobacteraeota bacterium]|nr:hypothetical protein [Candidatus Eremiobacteraeota bacterium]